MCQGTRFRQNKSISFMIICIFVICHGDKGHEIEISLFYIFFVFEGLRWRRELRVRSSFQFQTGLQQPVGKLNLIKIQSTFYNVFDGM